MVAKKNEVAKTDAKKEFALQPGSANLPAFMQEDMGKGLENMCAEDMATPRLILMQALSKELLKNNALSAGDFFHSATEEIFSEPLLPKGPAPNGPGPRAPGLQTAPRMSVPVAGPRIPVLGGTGSAPMRPARPPVKKSDDKGEQGSQSRYNTE